MEFQAETRKPPLTELGREKTENAESPHLLFPTETRVSTFSGYGTDVPELTSGALAGRRNSDGKYGTSPDNHSLEVVPDFAGRLDSPSGAVARET